MLVPHTPLRNHLEVPPVIPPGGVTPKPQGRLSLSALLVVLAAFLKECVPWPPFKDGTTWDDLMLNSAPLPGCVAVGLIVSTSPDAARNRPDRAPIVGWGCQAAVLRFWPVLSVVTGEVVAPPAR